MNTLRKRSLPFVQLLIFFLGSFFIISSCGGGGGGGGTGSGTGTGTISYNGVKTQASITVANANKFFAVIWNGGPSSASPSSALGVASLSPADSRTSSSEYLKDSGTVSLFKRLKDRSFSDFTSFTVQSENIKRATSVNETHYGSVSGTLTITGNIDPNTLTGSLTMTYVNFNDGDGYTYDGPVTFKIDGFDLTYGMITDGTMSFTLWTIKSASSNVSLSGSIRVQESLLNNSDSLTVNMDGQDNNANDTFRFQNFVVAFNYDNVLSPTSETSYFSGRVFVGPYGYVDVSTTSPFVYSSYSQENPNSGGPIMLIGAGNTKAAVTPISTIYVKIDVDSDGDTVFESQNFYMWNNLTGAAVTITGAFTNDATNITDTTATLNGSLNISLGFTTTTWFEYGITTAYGNSTPPATYMAAGVFAVSSDISGLAQMTWYHYRIVTQNSAGTFYGGDKTFRTYVTPQIIVNQDSWNGIFDLDASYVYWIDLSLHINKVPLTGGTVTTIASVSPAVNPGAFEVQSGNVYWTEISIYPNVSGSLEKVGTDGGSVSVVASLSPGSSPYRLAVDSTSVYWCEQNTVNKVNMNGGTITPFASGCSGVGVVGVDSTSVYWTDSGSLLKKSINGGSNIIIASVPDTLLITMGNGYIYWFSGGDIRKVSTDGGSVSTIVMIPTCDSVTVDSQNIYFVANGILQKVSINGGDITPLANAFTPFGLQRIFTDTDSLYYLKGLDIVKIPKSY